MYDGSNRCFPEIDTEYFELHLRGDEEATERFRNNKQSFLNPIYRVIKELNLCGKIEHLTVSASESHECSQICPYDPWPSKRLWLYIYKHRYMEKELLRHEFQHEADRWNKDMGYDNEIEKQWKRNPTWTWALNLAANISVDARLDKHRQGLGKAIRRKDFIDEISKECLDIFEHAWENPPTTWQDIDDLAMRLVELRPNATSKGQY